MRTVRTVRILRCADSGILVEVDTLAAVLDLHAALRETPPPGVREFVPAARTILLRMDAGADPGAIARHVRDLAEEASSRAAHHAPEDVVEIPVRYDGPDLGDVAGLLSMTERDVVAAHTAAEWTVAFCGFAPGFGYLVSDDPRFHTPRRGEARTEVPAGSVALAGEFSGVYPRPSPGGWQLIGRTERQIWNLDQDPPGVLRPGVRVRFVEEG